RPGLTITLAVIVFDALATFVSGRAAWMRSARESSFETKSVGGIPLEKSSGFATSTRTLPRRFCAPADLRASSDPAPLVQLKTISPKAAASANVPCEAPFPADETQAAAFSLFAVRDPISTSWPRDTSFPAIADA